MLVLQLASVVCWASGYLPTTLAGRSERLDLGMELQAVVAGLEGAVSMALVASAMPTAEVLMVEVAIVVVLVVLVVGELLRP